MNLQQENHLLLFSLLSSNISFEFSCYTQFIWHTAPSRRTLNRSCRNLALTLSWS
uniref:Uncharacterized protein n=1 Tax=Arundo donax TaxID=35708 RepID=A0A0A8YW68_ARUDO